MSELQPTEIAISINGTTVNVDAGTTILEAARSAGVEIPTLCWASNLTPVNACRLCVVEMEGSRNLVPACSRECEQGSIIHTESERVALNRKMILEFLDTTNDLSESTELQEFIVRYEADSSRYTEPSQMKDATKIEDDLFVRAYDRCVLCYKCVEACGDAGHDALVFGDLNDADGRLASILAQKESVELRPDLKLNTAVRYSGI